MARDKADRGETISNHSSKKGFGRVVTEDDDEEREGRGSKLGGELNTNEPLEPEILLKILNKKGKK
jgi:hypothetical protein